MTMPAKIVRIHTKDHILFGSARYRGDDLTKPEGRRFTAVIDYDLRIVFMTYVQDDDRRTPAIIPFESVNCIQFEDESPPSEQVKLVGK